MIISSFQAELNKIAKANRPGAMDLSRIHEENLRSQRRSLQEAEKPGAYFKAGLSGMVFGAAAPTIMYTFPAMADQRSLEVQVRKKYLADHLEKALKSNPKLMKGEDPKKIRLVADQVAHHYYTIPEALRTDVPNDILRRVQSEYRDPEFGPRWVLPPKFKDNAQIVFNKIKVDPNGRPILSQSELDHFVDVQNEAIVQEYLGKMKKALEGKLKPGNTVVNPNPKIHSLKFSGRTKGKSDELAVDAAKRIEDMARNIAKRSPIKDVTLDIQLPQAKIFNAIKRNYITPEKLNIKPFEYPPTLSSHVPGRNDILRIIKEIQNRHGKAPLPSATKLRMENAVRALKHAKGSIAISAGLGTVAGLVRIRNRRRQARELRKR